MAMLYPRRRLLLPPASLLSLCWPAWDYGGDRQGLAAEERADATRRAEWTARRLRRKASRRAFLTAAALAGVAAPRRPGAASLPTGPGAPPAHLDARDFRDDNGTPLRGGGDDAAAIRGAIAHAVANLGAAASIHLGPGPLALKSPIEIPGNIRLIGDGPNTTIATIAYSSDADIIATTGNPAGAGIYHVQFRLADGHRHTAGALLHLVNSHDCAVEDCVFWGGFFRHVQVTGGSGQYINYVRKCEINPSNPDANSVGILVDGYAQDVWLEDLEMGGNNVGRTGILLENCAGVQVRNVDMISLAHAGFAIRPQEGHQVTNTFIENLEVDSCAQNGSAAAGALIGMAGSGVVRNVHISNSWFASNKTAGLIVDGSASSTVNGIHLSNCLAANNGRHGAWVQGSANDVDLLGCIFGDNSQAKPDTDAGLAIGGAGPVRYVSVIGGRSGGNDRLGAKSGTQKYGYQLGGDSDYILLVNTMAHGNATGALNDTSTGKHNKIMQPFG